MTDRQAWQDMTNLYLEAFDFLRQKEISTVENLGAYLDKVSGKILSAKTDIRKSERWITIPRS